MFFEELVGGVTFGDSGANVSGSDRWLSCTPAFDELLCGSALLGALDGSCKFPIFQVDN